MSTIVRGNAAEGAVLQALTAAAVPVLVPFGDGLPFDLAAVLPDGSITRIQVKCGRIRKGCVVFNAHSTDHGRGPRGYRGLADFIGVHAHQLSEIYMVPVDDCPITDGWLRLEPPRNNQRLRVRFAADYTFARWAVSVGAA